MSDEQDGCAHQLEEQQRRQQQPSSAVDEPRRRDRRAVVVNVGLELGEEEEVDHQSVAEEGEADGGGDEEQEGGDAEDDATNLRNQFNFSERASQTLNNALRERGTMTEPPPV